MSLTPPSRAHTPTCRFFSKTCGWDCVAAISQVYDMAKSVGPIGLESMRFPEGSFASSFTPSAAPERKARLVRNQFCTGGRCLRKISSPPSAWAGSASHRTPAPALGKVAGLRLAIGGWTAAAQSLRVCAREPCRRREKLDSSLQALRTR